MFCVKIAIKRIEFLTNTNQKIKKGKYQKKF